jgi:hypothetical protein
MPVDGYGHLRAAAACGRASAHRSPIAGKADQVGETRHQKPKDQRLVGHGTLRKDRTPKIDPDIDAPNRLSGNRCAEHERSRVKSPKLYFFADSPPVYRVESDSRLMSRCTAANRAGAAVADLSFSGELCANTQDSRLRISGKVSGEGWIALLTSSFIPTERGCHGEESQEGEKGEEGPQEEVVWALLSWLGRKCPSLQVSASSFRSPHGPAIAAESANALPLRRPRTATSGPACTDPPDAV